MGALLINLLTWGGAAVALAHPFVGLLIYVSFSILKPESLWYDSVPPGNYSRIVGVAMLVGWAVRGFGKWRLRAARGVAAALAAFWLWSIVCAALAPQRAIAGSFAIDLAKIVLPFLVGVTTIDSTAKLKQLAWVIVLSQGAVAAVMNLDYLGGFNRLVEIGFADMDNNTAVAAMVAGLGPAFFLALGEKRWELKVLAAGVALAIAHAILISESRGGMLALLVTGAIGVLLIPRRPVHYAVLVVVAVMLLELASPAARERFLSSFADPAQRDASAQIRLRLWHDMWTVMLSNPVFGCGPAHWPLVAPQFGWVPGMSGHCMWLQTGAEMGVAGLALLVCFYGLCIARLWPLTRRGHAVAEPWHHDAARMVVAGLVGFAVAAQFLSVVGIEVPYYLALVGAGALKLTSTARTTVDQRAHRHPRETPSRPDNRLNPTAQPFPTYT